MRLINLNKFSAVSKRLIIKNNVVLGSHFSTKAPKPAETDTAKVAQAKMSKKKGSPAAISKRDRDKDENLDWIPKFLDLAEEAQR
jgi:hypothetical protein